MNSSTRTDPSADGANENTISGGSSSNSNRNTAIMNREINQLIKEVKEIKEDVKFLELMVGTINRFPILAGTCHSEEQKNDRTCTMKQIFQSEAALSRFMKHVTVLQLLQSELPVQFYELHENGPSLVFAALLFSREGNLSRRNVP